MDEDCVLSGALSPEEWAVVPGEVGKKLNVYVNDKIEELITAKAISETYRQKAETALQELEDKFKDIESALSLSDSNLTSARSTINELENQLSVCTNDITRLQTSSNKLEAEAAEFRHQRNLAFSEKDELAKTLERTSAEVSRLQTEMSGLTKQLQTAISAKCEAQSDSNQVANLKLSLEYKEKRLDQERSLLNNQVAILTQNLNERTEELLNMRKDNSLRCIQLENKLIEKSQELAVALETIKNLTDINNNLGARIEDFTEKLKTERDKEEKEHEVYRQEVEAQTKLAQLYEEARDEAKKHAEELTNAVRELQSLLREATEKYGDLETKHKELELSSEEIVAKKNECIAMLKQELDVANDILKNFKDSAIQNEVEEISPSAATASRLIKPGMSLTQIYTEYTNQTEELIQERQENSRLTMYIQQILEELEDKGPFLKKQREDYEIALETIKDFTLQVDNLIMDNQSLKEESLQSKTTEMLASKENARLKKEVADLSRQVCNLLREVSHSRGGSSSNSIDRDHDMSDSMSSADIITKRLVTFNDITELQSTNQRLLALVRELSSKQEEAECYDPSEIVAMKSQLGVLRDEHSNLLELNESNTKTITRIAKQRDTYKNLYEQVTKGSREDVAMREHSFMQDREGSSPSPRDGSETHSDDKVQDLESQLEKTKKEIDLLKEENETYRKEKTANEKILIQQMEGLRKESAEVTRKNCKLTSVIEVNNERFKIMQSNIDYYKKQITALEQQNKIYSESNIKHEQMVSYLKDETMQSQTKLSKAEVRLANLEKENALIYDRESRIVKELEFLRNENHSKNILESNIELIKATLDRNDAESRIKLEEQISESHRECSALRRRLQEEQDRFRELGDHLKNQHSLILNQIEEEKAETAKLREEKAQLRDELVAKQNQMEELSKKLKNLSSIPEGSTEISKYREVERKLFESEAQLKSLQNQITMMTETVHQHCSVAEGAEQQLKVLVELHENDRRELEAKLSEREAKILKLEEQYSEIQGELTIQTGDLGTLDIRSRYYRLEDEFKVIKMELEEAKSNLEASNDQIRNLNHNLGIAENKYSHEMVLHSNDLQTLTTLKEELAGILSEVEEIKHQKEQAVNALDEIKKGFTFQEEFFKQEKERLEERSKEMNQQNSLLLDQIQTLNNQLSIIQSQATDQSTSFTGDTSFNRSYTEDEVKSSEQLIKIIKYLRSEKDISVSKSEILEAEHLRLKSQFDLLTKQLQEAKDNLEVERQKSEVSMVSSSKHSELLRKVETLNAITDSNRTLRSERDALSKQVNDLRIRTSLLEEQIAPLQEQNKELSLKAEALHTENITLRGEATRWRQRSNALIEKSNRTSPEDWKKLQNERENLAKQLTIERGTTTKLNDELNTLKQDKTKLEERLRTLNQSHNQLTETVELNKEELVKLKEQVNSITQDLEQTREAYSKVAEEKANVDTQLEKKTDSITDLKNNLLAVRKIAKKYKQQFEELTKEVETLKQQSEERAQNAEKENQVKSEMCNEYQERISLLEQTHNDKITELMQTCASVNEEMDKYKKKVEEVKQMSLDKEERFKNLFKNAKDRIVTLTEQNNNLRAELNGSRSSDVQGDVDRSGDVDKLIKEKEDILLEKQQEKERFTSEIEALTQKITQLQRQLGQQSSKPSTSSGASDKSTTEPPTANIKPMATNTQTQSIQIQPWRTLPETPLASIRPMSMQLRTVTVLPTSQGPSTAVLIAPQQVHTTGPSNIEQISNSPTSSHTEYMPATSSATPTVVGPRQVAVPPTQSTQDTEDEDSSMQMQPAPQQQAVALVLPRVEQPNNGHAQESGTSSSSNTVTTTQAGLKRPREVDTDSCQNEDTSKTQQLSKRTRVQTGSAEMLQSHGTVSDSSLEVEYQVPTSSQRDHEEDTVIVVESDEDGEGPDEGEGADDDQDDAEGYDMEAYPEQELNYDDGDCQEMEEDEAGNEVEVVEDSSEVPNQSQCEAMLNHESSEQAQSEAISSGTDGSSGVTVSQASPSIAVTMPSFSRTRPVAPLSRQQQQSHLLIPHVIDEGGDDGIVPSTPTLFVPRRSDGFGEAVSSPHVPTSGRFTFTESASSNNSVTTEVVPEQTLEFSHADDNSRSVPSTPLQSSPQEAGLSNEDQNQHNNVTSEPEIPIITVSAVSDEAELGGPNTSLLECMGPPSTAGPSGESQSADHSEELLENEDGVTSEGEKPLASEEDEEEGREAEASPSTNTRSRTSSLRGTPASSRRSMRNSHMQGGMSRTGPTPIVWEHSSGNPQNAHRGRGQSFATRSARRSRGRAQRSPFNRF